MVKNKKEKIFVCPSPIDKEWDDLSDDEKKNCVKKNKVKYTSSFLTLNTLSWVFYISIWVFGYALIENIYTEVATQFTNKIIFNIILFIVAITIIILIVFIDKRKDKFQNVI